jgi:hypothetical protein
MSKLQPDALLGSSITCFAGIPASEIPTPKREAAWLVDFDTWARTSSGYAGVDAEMHMRLKTLYFYANRPTIGALMGLGLDLGAAFKSGDTVVRMHAHSLQTLNILQCGR